MRKVVLVLAALLLVGCSEPKSDGQRALEKYVGTNISALSVPDLSGKPVALKDILAKGKPANKPVVLNVWATWCAPCTEELPSLDALGKQGNYTVVAISTDKDTADIQEYLKHNTLGSGMTVLWDSLGAVTTPKIGSRALPSSYVIDTHGVVREVEAGARDWVHPSMQKKMTAALQ